MKKSVYFFCGVIFTLSLFFGSISVAKFINFPDVPTDVWFYDDVMKMVEWNVIKGNDDGTFEPDRAVNRAELSAMWNRYDNRVKGQLQLIAHFYYNQSYLNHVLHFYRNNFRDISDTELTGLDSTSDCTLLKIELDYYDYELMITMQKRILDEIDDIIIKAMLEGLINDNQEALDVMNDMYANICT